MAGVHGAASAAGPRHYDSPRISDDCLATRTQLARVATLLLILLAILALVDIWEVVVGAGLRIALAIAVVTILALIVGHLMGGPDRDTRTAVAISSAVRNPGLALLVATLNAASPAINAAVLAYFVFSALTVIPYVIWRRRAASSSQRER